MLAFTGQRGGRDVLYLMDVKSRKVTRRIDLQLDQVLSPSFSPDGRRIVFSGLRHGSSDLYIVSLDEPGYKQITKDQFGDLQPQWSPDGKTIAFASDRGDDTEFEILKIGKLKISLFDVESGAVRVLPNQAGLNINPQWAPDGRSIAYMSDRTGTSNLFLYDLGNSEHYQLTNVAGAINSVAEVSPAITWARGADVLAFVYYEKGEHAIWKLPNPRSLKKEPFRTPAVIASTAPGAPTVGVVPDTATADPTAHLRRGSVRDTTIARQSFYRPQNNRPRASSDLAASNFLPTSDAVSVRAMMDSFDFNLPDTTQFRDTKYKVRFSPEYISQPSIGYQNGGYGQGTYGGTTIILSDLLGNNRLALSGAINGQLSDAQVFIGYTNLGRRLQYATGVTQQPMYLQSGGTLSDLGNNQYRQSQEIIRLVLRQAFLSGIYPLDRFKRFELGARFQNIDQQAFSIYRDVDYSLGLSSGYEQSPTRNVASANTVAPYVAFVKDNSLNGYTGPISGTRARFQFEPSFGSWRWNEYLADVRHYTPLIFNYVTFATRFVSSISVGRDESRFPKWVGRPDFIRGYNRDLFADVQCSGIPTQDNSQCGANETVGSRVAFANAELRFPIVRRLGNGRSIGLPPLDGLLFYDAGVAWSQGQSVSVTQPAGYDISKQRELLQSYGFGFRLNLFNIAIIRWDWAVPFSRPGEKAFGTWFFGASY